MNQPTDKTIREVLEGMGLTDLPEPAAAEWPESREASLRARQPRRTRVVTRDSQMSEQDRYDALNRTRPCWVVPGQPYHLMDEARARALQGGAASWREWRRVNGHDSYGACLVCTPPRWLDGPTKRGILAAMNLMAGMVESAS